MNVKCTKKDMYPAVEKFLKTRKNCIAGYVGTELSLKQGRTSLRADVFGCQMTEKTLTKIALSVR